MVSNNDLKKDIGKHIAFYPVKSDEDPDGFDLINRIEGSSFDLTASCYAWSANTGRKAVTDRVIEIQPHDTVIVFTNEIISIDNYYAGACYDKLKFSMHGIIHSSSPLKPGYTGRLSVSLYNSGEKVFLIKVGDPIVVIILSRLRTPASVFLGNGNGQRFDILSSMNISVTEEERAAIVANSDKTQVFKLMKDSQNYKDLKKAVNAWKIKIKSVVPYIWQIIIIIITAIITAVATAIVPNLLK